MAFFAHWTARRTRLSILALLVVGILVVPRIVRRIVKVSRPEGIVITSAGICFGIALLVREFGTAS